MSENSAFPIQFEEETAFLRLLQLADSALPIGSLAHSFGVETLTSSDLLASPDVLEPKDLAKFLKGYLEEAGTMQAVFCRAGFQAASGFSSDRWVELNEHVCALKPARETRTGDAALGKRFLITIIGLGDFPLLQNALDAAQHTKTNVHHGPAFGLASAVLAFDQESVVLAYLHQWAASLVSAFQRLLPVGQTHAMKLLWELKPIIIETTKRSRACTMEEVGCFTPLLDWGGMEHPALSTRLFIS